MRIFTKFSLIKFQIYSLFLTFFCKVETIECHVNLKICVLECQLHRPLFSFTGNKASPKAVVIYSRIVSCIRVFRKESQSRYIGDELGRPQVFLQDSPHPCDCVISARLFSSLTKWYPIRFRTDFDIKVNLLDLVFSQVFDSLTGWHISLLECPTHSKADFLRFLNASERANTIITAHA